MKGKGKGDRKEEKKKEEEKDCPLQFPDLNPIDQIRSCPRYTQVLARSEDGIGIEELDTLQTELETLLSSVAKRMRLLESETQILSDWQEKGKDGAPTSATVSPVTTPVNKKGGKGQNKEELKRSAGKDEKEKERPSKKLKGETTPTSGKGAGGKPKGKAQPPKAQEYEFTEASPKPPDIPRVPKMDTPNRFWTLVEPYASDITNDDMKTLEEIVRSHEDDGDFYKIPALGKHYAQKWAQEDLLEEQNEGGKLEKRRSASMSADGNALLKRMEECDPDESPFGPLTQRLVSALIEENIMTPLEDSTSLEIEAAEAASMSPRSLAKQLNIGNPAQLERRIRRELEEQGILDADEEPEDDPDDEILMEMKKKQQELRAVSQQTVLVTKRLQKMAKEEIHRQDLRRKLASADNDVMEAYRKIQASRLKKKKVPTATLR